MIVVNSHNHGGFSMTLTNPASNPIIFSFYSDRGGLVVPREIVASQKVKKKNIDNRYDYTLYATQDDKHHDNARTN